LGGSLKNPSIVVCQNMPPRRRSWVERHPIATAAGLMGGAAVVFGAMRRSRARELLAAPIEAAETQLLAPDPALGPALGAAPDPATISPTSTPAAVVNAATVASDTNVLPRDTSNPPSAHMEALQTDFDRIAEERNLKKIKADNERALADRQKRLAQDFAKKQQEEEKTLAFELKKIKEENRLAAEKHQEQLNQTVAEFKAKEPLSFKFAWPEDEESGELPDYNFNWGG
jgi:flagellar biosynthesis GTPase FlhF